MTSIAEMAKYLFDIDLGPKDEWVSTFSPEVARLTERLLETGELPANLMYSVPREYADAHPDHDRTIWVYRQGSMETGEPFDLRSVRWATDL